MGTQNPPSPRNELDGLSSRPQERPTDSGTKAATRMGRRPSSPETSSMTGRGLRFVGKGALLRNYHHGPQETSKRAIDKKGETPHGRDWEGLSANAGKKKNGGPASPPGWCLPVFRDGRPASSWLGPPCVGRPFRLSFPRVGNIAIPRGGVCCDSDTLKIKNKSMCHPT